MGFVKVRSINNLLKWGKSLKILFVTLLVFTGLARLNANNVQISNVSLTNKNETFNTVDVKFDISWDNSWRTSTLESNWDACWVFVKYRLKNKDQWNHATLNYVDGTGSGDGHNEPSGGEIDSEDDTGGGGSYGVFIYSESDLSQQSVSYNNVNLRWKYGTDGVADNDRVEVSVFAIEMVYIPEGKFELGDGNGSNESSDAFHSGSTDNNVTIDNTLTSNIKSDGSSIHNSASIASTGVGIDGDGGLDGNNDNSINYPNFPTGYKAFYVMKYELSMGQYTEFLNHLTPTQQNNRDNTSNNGSSGFTISKSGSTFSTSTPNRACNFINWPDMTAYADWAGLRPMTELEYEKACRGGVSAIYGEFPWGNTNLHTGTDYTVNNAGMDNELISNPVTNTGNAYTGDNYDNFRPVRCGIFAASATNKTREETGATIYGVMEMAGNLLETCISLGRSDLYGFKNHGDGSLTSGGYADLNPWDEDNSNKIDETNPDAIMYRGGSINSIGVSKLQVSYRAFGPQNGLSSRASQLGFRCARSAP